MFDGVYAKRKVLITGHTGFKGSWLALWLRMLGAEVTGISFPPETSPNHWDLLELDIKSSYVDICNEKLLREAIEVIQPEMVFHLAAQPLVRRSYLMPLENWATNVMGTANVLDACRKIDKLAAIVVVTTDKCYQNKEWVWGYRETDPLGGHDPYSASKGASELVAASYRQSFFNTPTSPLLATARAGNVIGGGDWSEDRLIPDLIRSTEYGKTLEIRSPDATRPWQHVLDCLSGYLALGQQLLKGKKSFADSWNFGPDRDGNRQVKQVLAALKSDWHCIEWTCTNALQPHEARLLYLDCSKARDKLLWRPVWNFDESISATGEWYREWLDRGLIISFKQMQNYMKVAKERQLIWTGEDIQ